jgi:hypothetical protein
MDAALEVEALEFGIVQRDRTAEDEIEQIDGTDQQAEADIQNTGRMSPVASCRALA